MSRPGLEQLTTALNDSIQQPAFVDIPAFEKGIGKVHHAVPMSRTVGQVCQDVAQAIRDAQPKRELNSHDLSAWEQQISSEGERIAHAKKAIANIQPEIDSVAQTVATLEEKIKKIEAMPVNSHTMRALTQHREDLIWRKNILAENQTNLERHQNIAAGSQKVLDELPWADIKALREQEALFAEL